MEERLIDKENERKIKIKKNAVGGITDAVEEGSEQELPEEEITFEIPQIDETNEDLIGLSEEQMLQLKRRQEEADRERDKLLEEAERLLKKEEYADAEAFFAQALLYDPDSARANEAIWICRTGNFADLEPLYDLKYASAVSELDERTKAFIRKHAKERLEADRISYEEEAAPLKKTVLAAQKERRAAFERNRNYFLVRFTALISLFFVFLVATPLSAYFIVRTTSSLPVILTIVFGALALLFLAIGILFSRKLLVAQRYCRENEKLSSTEEGERLEYLLRRLKCLKLILDDEE